MPRANSQHYNNLTLDIMDKFVGPMPVDEFFQEFVPEAPTAPPTDTIAFSGELASGHENQLIEAIERSGLCPNLSLKNTTTTVNTKGIRIKPDISVFPRSLPIDPGSDWRTTDLWIENKLSNEDFILSADTLKNDKKNPLSHVHYDGKYWPVCGQMINYASTLHRLQFRIFSFSIALFGETGRIFRWDRSGVIYTEPFKWKTQPKTLFEFLWRFNHLTPPERGHDPTVFPATEDEKARALPVLRGRLKYQDLKLDNMLSKIIVKDDCAQDKDPRAYIVPQATWTTDALVGRATFGYVGYDLLTGELVYLKDFWRLDLPGIQKEGDVYRDLGAEEVPNIAKFGGAGDVPSRLDPAPSGVQRTRTQEFIKGAGRADWCPGRPQVEPYVHYRLVLETLGRPLNQFDSTRQLCQVIRDAVVAHSVAYEKSSILHRDISVNNILITNDGKGILIDWDLSKKLSPGAEGKARRVSRKGTWPFISMGLLQYPTSKSHELLDDLESFFWVLLYQIVRCRGSSSKDLQDEAKTVFDYSKRSHHVNAIVGGKGKHWCLKNDELSSADIGDIVKTPCADIIEDMRSLFADFYLHVRGVPEYKPEAVRKLEDKRARDPTVQEARKALQSSKALLDIFEKRLASPWEITDDASENLRETRCPSVSKSRKRKRGEASDPALDEEASDPTLDENGRDYYMAHRWQFPPALNGSRSSADAYYQVPSLSASAHSSTLVNRSSGAHGRVSSQTRSSRSLRSSKLPKKR
ncbi:hypothetical protein BC834DRAFT_928374 [Gloeopeniophorella convolvens]|nr:hypothetical protein BC834DRAFT_928374 [Gloeopeniophorella convolvens]